MNKKMRAVIILLAMLAASCQQSNKPYVPNTEKFEVMKVIDKITDIQSDSELKWGTSGKWYPVSTTKNVYYLITSDRELREVSLHEYVKVDVGDSVKVWRYGEVEVIK